MQRLETASGQTVVIDTFAEAVASRRLVGQEMGEDHPLIEGDGSGYTLVDLINSCDGTNLTPELHWFKDDDAETILGCLAKAAQRHQERSTLLGNQEKLLSAIGLMSALGYGLGAEEGRAVYSVVASHARVKREVRKVHASYEATASLMLAGAENTSGVNVANDERGKTRLVAVAAPDKQDTVEFDAIEAGMYRKAA